eukprot:SAG11_NODE_11505_length_756_cov_1.210046_1_plen_31_part_10
MVRAVLTNVVHLFCDGPALIRRVILYAIQVG